MTTRLLSYGSLTLGATTLLSGNADAATVVIVNSTSYNTGLSNIGTATLAVTPAGSYFKGQFQLGGQLVGTGENVFQRGGSGVSFTPDGSFDGPTIDYSSSFFLNMQSGAVVGSDNWLYAVSSVDSSQRVWLQMNFNQVTGSNPVTGSIVKAVFPSFAGELPTAQAASSAVPEPSAMALLSLGATGLVMRRRRRAA